MDTTYKIYAGILDERLKADIENKLEVSQFGFRNGRGVTDAVFVINHIIHKQLIKKKGNYMPALRTSFNIYEAGLEEELRKGQAGGTVVGERKAWSLKCFFFLFIKIHNLSNLDIWWNFLTVKLACWWLPPAGYHPRVS